MLEDVHERLCGGDIEPLSDLLEGVEGRFIMSINDTSEIRELFGRFAIE